MSLTYDWKGYATVGSAQVSSDPRERYVFGLRGGWGIRDAEYYTAFFDWAVAGYFEFRSDAANYGRVQWTDVPQLLLPVTDWTWHYADASMSQQPNVPAGTGPYWLPWAVFDLSVRPTADTVGCLAGCGRRWSVR